jgi:hypothetical protein
MATSINEIMEREKMNALLKKRARHADPDEEDPEEEATGGVASSPAQVAGPRNGEGTGSSTATGILPPEIARWKRRVPSSGPTGPSGPSGPIRREPASLASAAAARAQAIDLDAEDDYPRRFAGPPLGREASPPPSDGRGGGRGLFDSEEAEQVRESPPRGQEEQEEPTWVSQGLAARTELAAEFGPPRPRDVCFGCAYSLDKRTTGVYHEDLQELFALPRKFIGQAAPKAIASAMAERYRKIRTETNARAQDFEDPLPPWEEADILECMYHHNCDPQLQLYLRLTEMQDMMRVVTEKGIIERHAKTGAERLHKENLNGYCKLVDTYYKTAARDPSKLIFYSDGTKLDPVQMKRGIIGAAGKNIISFYQPQNFDLGGATGLL